MNPLLKLENVHVNVDSDTEIIRGLNLTVNRGEFHVIMGPNGSGKSTLALALMGYPRYNVSGTLLYDGVDLTTLEPDERARRGLFLAFQHPPQVEGVRIIDYARLVIEKVHNVPKERSYDIVVDTAKQVNFTEHDLKRYLNVGFSGGERKRIELLLALLLDPKLVMLDEPDSGVDVDSLTLISKKLGELQRAGKSILMITHYGRILRHVNTDKLYVHIMRRGQIVLNGGRELVSDVEERGFETLFRECGCDE